MPPLLLLPPPPTNVVAVTVVGVGAADGLEVLFGKKVAVAAVEFRSAVADEGLKKDLVGSAARERSVEVAFEALATIQPG
jgi:hypothetical protein